MTLYLSFPRLKYSSMKTNPISRCKITKFTGNLKATCAGIDLNLFFTRSSLVVEGCDDTSEDGATTLYTRCQDPSGVCPYCGHESEKIHSRYTRHLQDLPAFGKRIRLCFEARRFFCRNESCRYMTFAEQPGNEVFRYRRRTRRCEVAVHRHGLSVSSIQSSMLLNGLGIGISKSTVLRDLHRMQVPDSADVRRIGVDDWAFRKGVDYGSVIVDLSTGRPIDMLPGRSERDFSAWLKDHGSVWLLSRDRSSSYSSAVASCGFQVTEIADRFHLMKNLGECVTDTLCARYGEIAGVLGARECPDGRKGSPYDGLFEKVKRLQAEGRDVRETMALLGVGSRIVQKYRKLDVDPVVTAGSPAKGGSRRRGSVHEGRFNEVKRLQGEGRSATETAVILGMSGKTVEKYRSLASYPTRKRTSSDGLGEHTGFVEERYARGISLDEIHRTLIDMGVSIGRSVFYAHFRYLSDGHRGYRPAAQKARMEEDWKRGLRPEVLEAHVSLPPVREVARTVMKDVLGKDLSENERRLIDALSGLGWFSELHEAAMSFRQNLYSGCPALIDTWIEKYGNTKTTRLMTFVKGLRMDVAAVRNAVLFRESNGITEGYVNKLKTIKRSMYGRARLPLLKVKMVMPPFTFT